MTPEQKQGQLSIRALSEAEAVRGWLFDVEIDRPGGAVCCDVALSWVDYEHWCHGAASPSRVAEAVVRAVVEAGVDVPARFDASTARRWVRELDARVREAL